MYFDLLSLSSLLLLYYFQIFISKQKLTKTYQNTFSVLFLGWHTHHYIAGNLLAFLHGLRLLQLSRYGTVRYGTVRYGTECWNIRGVLSFIFYALVTKVSIKYAVTVSKIQ